MTPSYTILLIEDDLAHAEITRRNLEEFSPHIRDLVHVADGQAALDYLSSSDAEAPATPNLILLDLRLPRVDGLEVLRQIKLDMRLKSIPVVVLTTSHTEADVRGAYERGANGYLVKPIQHADYLALTRALGQFWLTANQYVHA
jgi:two-component system, response regulator